MNIVNLGYDSANYYLLGDRSRLLIDVGFPGTLPKLTNLCQRKGVPWQEIKYLLVTHYHPDHAGLAEELKRRGVQLIVVETQLAAIPRLRTYLKPEQHYLEINLSNNYNLRLQNSRKFLLGLGLNGEILSTPGHSDDSITLILDEKIAFTGDLPLPMFSADPTNQVEQSWQQIRAHQIQTIYPGHGPVRKIE
jgi:glyoxylase-like metal-dependent hydrolase (beta-lactamase superfamily II)